MFEAKPKWVVQTGGVHSADTDVLLQAIRSLGYHAIEIKFGLGSVLSNEVLGRNLIPYGSTELVKQAHSNGWKHVFFDETTFRVDCWLKNHPRMLNEDAQIMTLSEAKQLARSEPHWFIRPLKDLKDFAGHVIEGEELLRWVSNLEKGDCEIDGSCLVSLAKPKRIQMEWRYFVVDGRIVTGSSYRLRGQPYRKREHDHEVLSEAQRLVDMWLPHPCCCVDIALCDSEVKVVEFNTLNASGFYDSDIPLIVKAVSEYAFSMSG